ncbi:MAG: nucleotidyltransferase domain-containing protein [Desulfatiglandaceae bacterium]
MGRIQGHRLSEGQRGDIVKEITKGLSRNPEILFAFIHGSFCDEPFFRDIDLGIFVGDMESSGFWDYECSLSQQIEDALSCLFTVEAKVITGAPLSFCYNVLRGKLIFVRDEGYLVDFMVRVARGYLDMAPLRQGYMKEAMA